ncbi:unnamed protein product [Symbiodinium sp. KB8]|nr:unnamed protein product [Symbiodinium sp. KB8]
MQASGDWDEFDDIESGTASLDHGGEGSDIGARRRVRFDEGAESQADSASDPQLPVPAEPRGAAGARQPQRARRVDADAPLGQTTGLDTAPRTRTWHMDEQRRYFVVQGLMACGGLLLLALVLSLVIAALSGGVHRVGPVDGSRFASTGGIRLLSGSVRGSELPSGLGPPPAEQLTSAGFDPIESLAPLSMQGLQRIAGGTASAREAHILVAVTSCCDTLNLTTRLLRNLAVLPDPIHVVVVDDASIDGAPEFLGDLGIEVVENVPETIALGLTHSWNVAWRLFQADQRYTTLWIINNDVLVAPHSFSRLDQAARQTVEPRVVSPMTDALGLGHNPRCPYQNVEEVYFEGPNGTSELELPDALLDALPRSLGDTNQWMINNSIVSVDDVDPDYVLGYFVGFRRDFVQFESQPGHILPPTLLNLGQEDYWFDSGSAGAGGSRPKPAIARRVFVYHDKGSTMREAGSPGDLKTGEDWKRWNHVRDDVARFHDPKHVATNHADGVAPGHGGAGVAFSGGKRAGAASRGGSAEAAALANAEAAMSASEGDAAGSGSDGSADALIAALTGAGSAGGEQAQAGTGAAPQSAGQIPTPGAGALAGSAGAGQNPDPFDLIKAAATARSDGAGVSSVLPLSPTGGSVAVPSQQQGGLDDAAAQAEDVATSADAIAASSTDPQEQAEARQLAAEARAAAASAKRGPNDVLADAVKQASDAKTSLAARLGDQPSFDAEADQAEAAAEAATVRVRDAIKQASDAEAVSEANLGEAERERARTEEELASIKAALAETELRRAQNAAKLNDARLRVMDEEHEQDAQRALREAKRNADAASGAAGAAGEGGLGAGASDLADAGSAAQPGAAEAEPADPTQTAASGDGASSLADIMRDLGAEGEEQSAGGSAASAPSSGVAETGADSEAQALAAKLARSSAVGGDAAAASEDIRVVMDALDGGSQVPTPSASEQKALERQLEGLTKAIHAEMTGGNTDAVNSASADLTRQISEARSIAAGMSPTSTSDAPDPDVAKGKASGDELGTTGADSAALATAQEAADKKADDAADAAIAQATAAISAAEASAGDEASDTDAGKQADAELAAALAAQPASGGDEEPGEGSGSGAADTGADGAADAQADASGGDKEADTDLKEAESMLNAIMGADLVDEVLSLCGLGLTDRNRRRVVLANQETGELVHGCGALGEVEWGEVATVEVALALSSRPGSSADAPDTGEAERALAAAAEYEQAIAATLARAEEARRSGASPEARARCLGSLIGQGEAVLRQHAFASMAAMKTALKRASGIQGALGMDSGHAGRALASAEGRWQAQLDAMEQELNPDCTAGDDGSGAAAPGTASPAEAAAGAGAAGSGLGPDGGDPRTPPREGVVRGHAALTQREGGGAGEFAAKRARVVVVSFMQSAGLAEKWSRQVGAGFAHARDPAPGGAAGTVYSESFRFRRSVAGVWSSASLGFYAEQKAAGRELESSHGQDVNQLAGDMVVGSDGRMLLAYYSKDNTDRPSVDELLAAVAKDATPPGDAGAAPAGEVADWVLSLPEAPAALADHPTPAPAPAEPPTVVDTAREASSSSACQAAHPARQPAATAEAEPSVGPRGGVAAMGPALAAWAAAGAFAGTLLALAASRLLFGFRSAE